MSAMASQITDVSILCSSVCSGADQRKHQSSASLAFVSGIGRRIPPHKGSVTHKKLLFDDVIMPVYVSTNLILDQVWDNHMWQELMYELTVIPAHTNSNCNMKGGFCYKNCATITESQQNVTLIVCHYIHAIFLCFHLFWLQNSPQYHPVIYPYLSGLLHVTDPALALVPCLIHDTYILLDIGGIQAGKQSNRCQWGNTGGYWQG